MAPRLTPNKALPLSAAHQKIYEAYIAAIPGLTEPQLRSLRSNIRLGKISAKDFEGKLRINDEIFKNEYKKFQKLKKNLGTDLEFAEHLNKNYKPKIGEVFTPGGIQIKRLGLKIKSPVIAGTSPVIAKRFDAVTDYATQLVNEANTGEKFVRMEDIKTKVMDKFKLKSFPNFKSESYPILNRLHKAPEKIDFVLRNMLKEDVPLNQIWVDEVVKRTGISRDGVGDNLNKSQEYNKIKDKGADYIKRIGGKKLPRDFYTMSFSEQLPYALEIESGSPRYIGMGGEGKYGARPQNKIMQFALRSWNQLKGSPDGPIQFFKKGSNTPITWKHGLLLPWRDVSFSYDGNKHTFQDLRSPYYMKNYFSELYEKQNALNRLGKKLVDNPFKKGTITVRELINEIQRQGYGWKPTQGSLDILHGKKGVALRPFTDLTYSSKDINQLEGGIASALKANPPKITRTQANKALKIIRSDIKGLTGRELDTAIIDRQGRLAKRIKAGTIGGYRDLSDAVRTIFNESASPRIQNRVAVILGCVGEAEGGRIGFALGTAAIRCVNTKLTQQPLESSQKIVAGVEEGATGVLGKIRNTARGFLGALGRFGPAAGKYGAIAAAGALAQPLVKQFRNDDPSTYLTDENQIKGMLEGLIETQERTKPRSEILDWGMGAGQLGATAAAIPGSGALYKFRRGLSEAKIPKAGPITEGGLTAGDYLSKHAGKDYGKLRAGAGVGMKLLSGMFTPAGLLATEPLRIAQKRREGESWGEIATSPMTWMGPAFAPSMTKIATAGMKKGSLLPRLLRLGISRGALAAMGPVGWVGLAASLGWEGYSQYQDYKKGRGFFAED